MTIGRPTAADLSASLPLKTPAQWSEELGFRIMDPDGWRFPDAGLQPRSFDDPITRGEFDARSQVSTTVPVSQRHSGSARG